MFIYLYLGSQDANAAAWAAYYAQYYAQQQQQQSAQAVQQPQLPQQSQHSAGDQSSSGQAAQQQQGDFSQQWVDYYRAFGMHKEADMIEQHMKMYKVLVLHY